MAVKQASKSLIALKLAQNAAEIINMKYNVCLCWGFMAQSTQWGHVECG